ncbi:hypothetical protein [Gloeobacter kilaueensis]|uniref:Uncharacterized protein n=1 Tax=Gloeobacter kilaueensis (strain ATCC BAA-2537 / CCAP 1431/1 / ULC 316 / JS1) TaxID=1183438 RepID=U5QQD1_GLOK1|nr:hypothetical protein [Gloeobacter kilaueensis]AGY59885.1 hypothetical protein GKIL_3639 [Gloeobacter kilaueensis JS1]
MPNNSWTPAQITAIVFLTGFAVQQVLQIFDPLVICLVSKLKEKFFQGQSDNDLKKSTMSLLSFALGIVIVLFSDIRLLKFISTELAGWIDLIVSALVVGAGTEAVNTLQKFFGYVKDAQKLTPVPGVLLVPNAIKVKQGTTFHFRANTTDIDAEVK